MNEPIYKPPCYVWVGLVVLLALTTVLLPVSTAEQLPREVVEQHLAYYRKLCVDLRKHNRTLHELGKRFDQATDEDVKAVLWYSIHDIMDQRRQVLAQYHTTYAYQSNAGNTMLFPLEVASGFSGYHANCSF